MIDGVYHASDKVKAGEFPDKIGRDEVMTNHRTDLDVHQIARAIDHDLPAMARAVVERYLDLSDSSNRAFAREPDDRHQHQTQWHQWGIITHTRVFLRQFDSDVPRYLDEWGLWEAVDVVLCQTIDGVIKRDLLRIAILLHDVGKFATRTRGQTGFHFAHHERLSGEIIRRDCDLERFGLTHAQIDYIATTAEDHFVLGILRKQARATGRYDRQFVDSPTFVAVAEKIKKEHPDDFVEIGVLFLGDSLAKADPERGPERAISQHEVNVAVAHRYLSIVLSSRDL